MSQTKKELFQEKLKAVEAVLPADSNLLIVSKTQSLADIKLYYDLGHRDFGENRVQDLLEKSALLKSTCPQIRWHMIGHLQSNKINQLFFIPNLWAIHSVSSEDLLEKMLKSEDKLSQPVNLFLQFNTSKEEEKSGFEDFPSLKRAAELLRGSTKLKLFGLMTMGTIRTENVEQEAKRCFQELNSYKKNLSELIGFDLKSSMGMSEDYQIALKEESNWIRLGTMMFSSK